MANTKPRKRPCSVCRTWFLPNVRQKGRQTTCSPECRKERHRRNCEAWNKKNKPYFREIYLNQKLEPTNRAPPDKAVFVKSQENQTPPASRINLHIPYDIVKNDIGLRQFIIVEYLIEQIVRRRHLNTEPFT